LKKEKWAKCETKHTFAGGVCTTSRIEGLHGVLKKYVTSTSSLQNVLFCFREIEYTQIQKFNDEYTFKRVDESNKQNTTFIEELKKKLSYLHFQ